MKHFQSGVSVLMFPMFHLSRVLAALRLRLGYRSYSSPLVLSLTVLSGGWALKQWFWFGDVFSVALRVKVLNKKYL